MRPSTVHVEDARKTIAVCKGHDLGFLSTLSLLNSGPPFLAGEDDPSMNAALMSKPPRSRRSSDRVMRISSNTPSFDHFWRRRWQVWYGGYRPARSFQEALVRSIRGMPLRASRGFRRERPRGSVRVYGMRDSTSIHYLSERSIHNMLSIFHKSSSFLGP